MKLVVIGDQAVGKTSLISRFMHGNFIEKYNPTIGVDFFSKIVKNMRFQLWDTVKLSFTLSIYLIFRLVKKDFIPLCLLILESNNETIFQYNFHSSSGVLIVYDITNKKSLDKAIKLIQEVNEIVGKIPKILIGNKNDLKEKYNFYEKKRI